MGTFLQRRGTRDKLLKIGAVPPKAGRLATLSQWDISKCFGEEVLWPNKFGKQEVEAEEVFKT